MPGNTIFTCSSVKLAACSWQRKEKDFLDLCKFKRPTGTRLKSLLRKKQENIYAVNLSYFSPPNTQATMFY